MKNTDRDIPRIAIADYGMGNLLSICKALEIAGSEVQVTSNMEEMRSSDAIVLPGVGAFRDAMTRLSPFSETIIKEAESGKPILGICLGLQLMFTESTEGGLYQGLNFYKGKVVKLPDTVKVPQMGWNNLKILKPDHPLFAGIPDGTRVYFVHSFFGEAENQNAVLATTEYGKIFPAVVGVKHVLATQFHPEKSGEFGLRLLKNFIDITRKQGKRKA